MAGQGAGSAPPRPTPLALVAGAVAGGDLQSVAATAADALVCPVVIVIPGFGQPVVAPPQSLDEQTTATVVRYAAALCHGEDPPSQGVVVAAAPVRIGEATVGIVAAAPGSGHTASPPEQRGWLEAAAAAAAVSAVMHDTHDGDAAASDAILLAELAGGPPVDLPAFLVRARRAGFDLTAGGIALSARGLTSSAGELAALARIVRGTETPPTALIAALRPGTLLAVTPLTNGDGPDPAAGLVAQLQSAGLVVVASAPRRDPALLHDAVREAELLAELGVAAPEPAAHNDTFRLLIGVLLRDRGELEQLHQSTIIALAAYDARHDTDLIATLRAFLAHDGSTTETADAMRLHRHTVGYRLARVHEVSGLSPYESGGRERLSLGLKAHRILEAARRLEATAPARQ